MSSHKARGNRGRRNKTPSTRETASISSRRLSHRWLGVLVAGAALAVAAVLTMRPDAQTLYQRAQDVAPANTHQAEELAARAIAAAGGDFPAAQLLQCRLLGAQGKWIEARGGFSLIRNPAACNADELIELAAAAQAADELVLPEMALRALAGRSDASVRGRRTLIELHLAMGQRQQALVQCEELERLTPDDAFPWLAAAEIHHSAGRLSRAIDAYRQALERPLAPPQEVSARAKLVELLLQFQDATAARREFDKLTAQAGPSAGLRLKQARLLRLEGQPQDALPIVEEILREDPSGVAALLLRGVLRLDLDQAAQAAADLQRVVAAQPSMKEAHYKLSLALRRLGREQEAEKHLQTSARLNQLGLQILALQSRVDDQPHNGRLLRQLADLCDQAGRTHQAASWRARADSLRQ